jgi:hypothetical protein
MLKWCKLQRASLHSLIFFCDFNVTISHSLNFSMLCVIFVTLNCDFGSKSEENLVLCVEKIIAVQRKNTSCVQQ